MDVINWHRRSIDEFVRRVRSVRPDQWELPTPCRDWTVRDLVNHVVSEERWSVPLLAGATLEQVGDAYDGDLLGPDPVAAVEDAARQAREAVRAPGALDHTVHLSYGDEEPVEYLHQLFADHLVHGWDLAVATAGEVRLDPELVTECAGWFAARSSLYRQFGLVGPPVEVSPGASVQDRLLGAFGRDPHWRPPRPPRPPGPALSPD